MNSRMPNVTDWIALGREQLARRHSVAAATCFRTALVAVPSSAETFNDLGMALKSSGDAAAGARAYRRALALDPHDPAPLNNLANALAAIGDRAAAVVVFDQVLRRAPGFAEGYQNQGDNLRHLKRFDEALPALRAALALKPNLMLSHNSIAAVALTLGEIPESITRFRRALTLEPAAGIHSDLLFALTYDDTTTSEKLFAEYWHWADRYAGIARSRTLAISSNTDTERKLRIGYLSADLRDHPVARTLVGSIAAHDRHRFEVVLYPEITGHDVVTDRFRSLADAWRPTQGLSDGVVADRIRRDGIDLLIFVAPHTGFSRVTVAAHAAAPAQASIYGLSTTALPEIDAWFTDAVLHPTATTERFVETLVRLPSLFLHEPPEAIAAEAIQGGCVTFASFNNPAKHTPRVYRLWAQLLAETPGSRLRLKYRGVYRTQSLRRRIVDIFGRHGVGADRLDFVTEMSPRGDHLADLAEVDIALDPFPFNGCNTTFEALWMGVPVVTRAGDRFLSRMGASHLTQIGLTELIASDDDGYIAAAKSLAGDAGRRADLRLQLRKRVAQSLLCDPVSYARALEHAYRALWLSKVAGMRK